MRFWPVIVAAGLVAGVAGAGLPAFAQTPPADAAPGAVPRFDVLEFVVEGNTVLPGAAVEAAVLPFMGEGRTLADVEAARAALEKAYQDAGWLTVFVDLPEQRVDAGEVRLVVTQGRVDRLRVTGARWFSQGRIRATVDELAEGQVPNFNTVQAQLAQVNRTTDRQVQPVLRPGQAPGTVEVELKVADRLPVSGSIELTNRHPASTEPLRLTASVRYDNLFQRDQSLTLTAVTAPQAPEESTVLVANWSMPLAADRTLLAYVVASDSTVEPLAATTVVGKGTTMGLRWIASAFGSSDAHTLSLGADYKDLRERIDAQSDISTPLRYLPLQAAYTGQWQGNGHGTTLSTSLTAGVRSLLKRTITCDPTVGPDDQFACRREGADGGFAVWRGDLRHEHALPLGTLAARVGWQMATQPLVGSEQINIGGADTVRGYLESEANGDHGLHGTLEWRSPNLWPRADAPAARTAADGSASAAAGGADFRLNDVRVVGFVDAGRVSSTFAEPSPGERRRTPLLGAGIGLRLRAGTGLSADVDVAWPRKTDHQARADRDARLHARLGLQF